MNGKPYFITLGGMLVAGAYDCGEDSLAVPVVVDLPGQGGVKLPQRQKRWKAKLAFEAARNITA